MRGFAVLVFVAGCWGTTPGPPAHEPVLQPPPPVTTTTTSRSRRRVEPTRCERAIDNALEQFRAELDRMGIKPEVIRDAAVASCEATAWSDATTTCFETGADLAAMNQCRVQLTSDQLRDLSDRMRDAMNPATP
jgi:hypothetical protein